MGATLAVAHISNEKERSEPMTKKTKEKKVNPVAAFLWKDKRRRAKNFYFVLTVFVVLVSVALGYVSDKLDLITDDDVVQADPNAPTTQIIYDEEELQMMEAINSAGSVNEYLYQWANKDGEIYSSKNVINILLVGLDSADALQNGGRSDSLILVSLNKKTQKINMTSFFRDTWCYIAETNNYNKINASYFYGGSDSLIDTIEKNFKIDIDYYVAVDFNSFVRIIDALGGLTVEVQEYEANYINRTTSHTIESGPAVTLNGQEALVFARIRKSDADSDVSRTRRQRMVITSFIERAMGASMSQLNEAINLLFSHVKTDLTKMQIVSYATQALTQGWMNYEIVQHTLNDPEIFTTGYVGNSSVVFIEFPLAAQKLQTALYGDTNIVIDENRVKLFSLITRFN